MSDTTDAEAVAREIVSLAAHWDIQDRVAELVRRYGDARERAGFAACRGLAEREIVYYAREQRARASGADAEDVPLYESEAIGAEHAASLVSALTPADTREGE